MSGHKIKHVDYREDVMRNPLRDDDEDDSDGRESDDKGEDY